MSASGTTHWNVERNKKQTFSETKRGNFTLYESVTFISKSKNIMS